MMLLNKENEADKIKGMNESYYFDWAAASPFDSDILHKALDISQSAFANPSSIHRAGLDAKKILQEYRKRSAFCFGVKEECLYYTSGGTEGSQIILMSLLLRPSRGSVVISGIEHPAVREQALMLKHLGWDVITVAPDTDGIVQSDAVLSKTRDDTALVCVMAVNNETGAIQNVDEIAKKLEEAYPGKKKPKFHVDAVQAAGKIPLDLSSSSIDSACISGHKLGAPRGIGLLYLKSRQEPFLRGGGQEGGIRSGTENLFGAVALGLCLEKYCIKNEGDERLSRQKKTTSFFLNELKKIPRCTLIPSSREDSAYSGSTEYDNRFSPWIVQAAFPGIPSEVLVRSLSEKGIFISAGSACSARKNSRPVLEAMNVSEEISSSAVRFSFGYSTTENDISVLTSALKHSVMILS